MMTLILGSLRERQLRRYLRRLTHAAVFIGTWIIAIVWSWELVGLLVYAVLALAL